MVRWNCRRAPGIRQTVERATGPLYESKTVPGKLVGSAAEFAGNPFSYVGPGGLAMKLGAAAAGGVGSEAAGEATAGTPYEGAARLAGGVLGSVSGAKTLGPKSVKAEIPTAAELKTAAKGGYDAALNSGLQLKPSAVSDFATTSQQSLFNDGFTETIAPKTLAVLDRLSSPPAGAIATPSGLNSVRQTLGRIASETQPAHGGAVKPTPDAAAASRVLDDFHGWTKNIPQADVLAGDAAAYSRAIEEANQNYAASQRLGNVDARLTKAETATDRQVSGSLDSQIKSKVGAMLDNPARLRGLSPEEIDQLRLINSGSLTSNVLRQLGRGGAGVIPTGAHIAGAIATGGASIPYSLGIGIPLYAARKASEAMTVARANALAQMLAKRSPLYQQRLNALPPPSPSAVPGAVLRAIAASQ